MTMHERTLVVTEVTDTDVFQATATADTAFDRTLPVYGEFTATKFAGPAGSPTDVPWKERF